MFLQYMRIVKYWHIHDMKLYRIAFGALTTLVVVGGFCALRSKPVTTVETESSQGVMQLTNAGHAAPVKVGQLPDFSVSASKPPGIVSKREEVLRLSRSPDPSQKLLAYELIRACITARRDDQYVAERAADGGKTPVQPSSTVCGDIDPGQIASRRQLLTVAAQAGVHHAAAYLADEGSTGQGYSTDTDVDSADQQMFDSEMKQALEAGAASGDWWSLATLAGSGESSARTFDDYRKAISQLDDANTEYRKETGHDMKSYQENRGRMTYFGQKVKTAN